MFRVKNKVIRTSSASSVSLVDFEQVNVCQNVIKSLLNDFWSILKMLCSKCCSHLSNFDWCNALMELLLVICKPRHWNLGIGIGIGIGIGTDTTNAIISSSISGHVTNQKRYISTFTRPMDPTLNKVVTQVEGTPPTKLHDTSILWSRDK